MKKVLLATTVLVAFAGAASAEVAVSGSARMGITTATATGDAAFTSRVRIVFTGSGETDGGLSFGASVRNDQSGVGNTANGDSTVYISGAFGKITMGDVSGAPDALVGQVSGVGLTSLNTYNEIGFLGNSKTAALYTYSSGALSLGVGIGQPTAAGDQYSLAVKYATDAFSVAVGYESNNGVTQTSLLGSATFSGATVKAKVADQSNKADMAYALSVDYAVSGANLTAFYSNGAGYTGAGGTTAFDGATAYGLGASYDLGGGAKVVGGVAKREGSDAVFDLGVSMSF